jgi:hypothetical protein
MDSRRQEPFDVYCIVLYCIVLSFRFVVCDFFIFSFLVPVQVPVCSSPFCWRGVLLCLATVHINWRTHKLAPGFHSLDCLSMLREDLVGVRDESRDTLYLGTFPLKSRTT